MPRALDMAASNCRNLTVDGSGYHPCVLRILVIQKLEENLLPASFQTHSLIIQSTASLLRHGWHCFNQVYDAYMSDFARYSFHVWGGFFTCRLEHGTPYELHRGLLEGL